jgi:hypothetical protein
MINWFKYWCMLIGLVLLNEAIRSISVSFKNMSAQNCIFCGLAMILISVVCSIKNS